MVEYHGPIQHPGALQGGVRAAFTWQWALPLVPIAASMFCLSALVYYHTAMGGTGGAWGFLQGAVIFLYRWLGFVPTFMFGLLLFVWSSIWFVSGRWDNARTRLLWMGAFTLCVAILVNLGTPADAPPHAGLIGSYIAVRLTSVIGYAFGALLAVAASLASLLLATDFLFYRYFETLARGRVAEEPGVEPEAADAFRELAFGGVYAEEPRPATVAADATDGPAATIAGEPGAEPGADEGFSDFARALDQDIVVRPRRRRRESNPAVTEPTVVVPSAGEEAAFVAEALPAGMRAEIASVEATEESASVVQDHPAPRATAHGEAAAAAGASDLLERPPAAEEQVAAHRAEFDVRSDEKAGGDEPVVSIPRGTNQGATVPKQGSLFAAPAAVGAADFDAAARQVLAAGRASATMLRRSLHCSPRDAIAMLDALRAAGVIDGEVGSPTGRVLTTLAEWDAR